jgi:hypothetical protein
MSFKTIAALTCGVTLIAGLAATHPDDLRRYRWLRIGLSLPIVVLITSVFFQLDQVRGYFAMWGFGVLGFLWAGPMAHGTSWMVQQLIYGDQKRSTGVQASFAGARALRTHGDLKEAVELTQAELEKEPESYEGLLLLAELREEAGEHHQAARVLDRLLRIKNLSQEQRKCAFDRREKVGDWLVVRELNAR